MRQLRMYLRELRVLLRELRVLLRICRGRESRPLGGTPKIECPS